MLLDFFDPALNAYIIHSVALALQEDVGDGDITAQLIPAHIEATAQIISREPAILCGAEWVNETFKQLDQRVSLHWHAQDGDHLLPNQPFCHLTGPARALVTGERTALNFLQALSGTATLTQRYVAALAGTSARLFDTRKTLPGLRLAQKYAVICGGGHNHRIGLYDAFLLKENHIAACGSIANAIAAARAQQPDKMLEVEVENFAELEQALAAGADVILLDNFSLQELQIAVQRNAGQARLEASGGITLDNIHAIAQTGVDRISVGTLTKDIKAIDLSLRFDT